MIKNKYDEREQEYRLLLKKGKEVWEAQKNLGYIELDKPTPHGWDAEFILREDIARREDAWLYEYLLKEYGRKVWSRNKEFRVKTWKGKWVNIEPHIAKLWENDLEKYISKFKKFFALSDDPEDQNQVNYWKGRKFKCIVPYYFFKVKITRSYITHYKEHDEVLEQEDAYYNDKLKDPKYVKINKGWMWYGCASHWYRNYRNRQNRKQHKNEIHRFIREGKDPSFNDNYKDASWYC